MDLVYSWEGEISVLVQPRWMCRTEYFQLAHYMPLGIAGLVVKGDVRHRVVKARSQRRVLVLEATFVGTIPS